MTKSLATLTAELRRLRVLQTLHNSAEYTADLEMLCDYLVVSMMLLIEDAGWLEEHGLVELDQVDGVTSVWLTRLGKDVAMGRELANGRQRASKSLS
ncbi:MAG: ArsR family transcriptional regulator [Magnetococcales bacterium]|nr:ArsR family transcriptional regulator [Magnetococcales bacterium]